MSYVVIAIRPWQARAGPLLAQMPWSAGTGSLTAASPAHKPWVSTSQLSHPAPEVGRTVACSHLRSIPDVRLVRKPTKYSTVAADQRFMWHFRELQRSHLSASRFWHETTPGGIAEADQQHLDTRAGRCSTTLHTTKAARCNCGDTAHLSVITTLKPKASENALSDDSLVQGSQFTEDGLTTDFPHRTLVYSAFYSFVSPGCSLRLSVISTTSYHFKEMFQ